MVLVSPAAKTVIVLSCFLGLAIPAIGQNSSASKSKTIPGEKTTQTKPTSNNPVKGPGEDDQNFMKQAVIGDAAEIQLGQMAQSKAANPKVKQFGERMVKDHSQSDDQLKGLAQQQHVALPTSLDQKHQSLKDSLSSKSGAQFDQAYMRAMVEDHMKTVQLFKREAGTSKDEDVKNFAQQSLPVLESHLSEAKQIQSEVAKQ
jgi:putative membrane protein